ncbi:MAG TPA: hypothetical protein VFI56_15050 [Vicinamibacterales bacterium]|nr:hypothetical protein [Vicinamibacterales bacterium]
MRRTYIGLFLISWATLLVEVLLTRVFDVILSPHLSFMVITCAMFGLAVGGLFDMVWSPVDEPSRHSLVVPAAAFAASVCMLPLLLNVIPFSIENIGHQPFAQVLWFLLLYLVLLLPFFFAGLTICRIFSGRPQDIRRLYFADLSGAAIGTAVLTPLLPRLGPERLMIVTALAGLAAAACFSGTGAQRRRLAMAALIVLLVPLGAGPRYLTLRLHDNKRDALAAIARGQLEFSRWDPVSQISVVTQPPLTDSADDRGRKHVAYDGGTQSSDFFPFDGDFASLRRDLPRRVAFQFWRRAVLASHYLKRDSGHRALIIGSAGGQETKAALLFGASHIDAIEMVPTMVELGTGRYAAYIGGIFRHPAVDVRVGEGRSFLRASTQAYDVIQVFSNYTSSSIAAGSGALAPAYLQTREAFVEYYSHLRPDGIVQINHVAYPRTIATAAAAWQTTGRDQFRSHVMVFETQGPDPDYLPTVLIKMTPWTPAEVDDARWFFAFPAVHEMTYALVENPLDPVHSFLPGSYYAGALPGALLAAAPFNAAVVTDDRPFFHFLRRSLHHVSADQSVGLNAATAAVLNAQMRGGWLPMDWVHLLVASAASVVYGLAFLLAPLGLSRTAREPWDGRGAALAFFSLLGLGFITVELLFIQLFMKLIGYPLYAITTVIAVMLIGAACGSMCSDTIVGRDASRWYVAFAGILATGLCIWASYPGVSAHFMRNGLGLRIFIAGSMIAPMAFFMGMPFPLGILTLRSKPRAAIVWAWSMNGLCTTIGGVTTALCSLSFGFRTTMLVALGVYVLAGVTFGLLRQQSAQIVKSAEPLLPLLPIPPLLPSSRVRNLLFLPQARVVANKARQPHDAREHAGDAQGAT